MLGSKRVWWVVLWGVLYLGPSFAYSQTTGVSEISLEGTQRKRPFNFDGRYAFDIGGGQFTENKDEFTTSYVYFDSEFNFHFLKSLHGRISPWGRFFSGRSQERYDDNALETSLYLHEAWLSYEPFKFLQVKGGALPQSVLKTSMLVSNLRTFPGLRETIKADFGKSWAGALVFQQLVPTSHSVNDERAEKEALPRFNTAHAEITGSIPGWLELEARGGLFEWSQIPAKVIWESRNQGNEAIGETVADSRFLYEHKGWFGSGAACLCTTTPVDFVFEFSRIHNSEAPGYAADAQLWGIGPKIKWPGYEIDIRYRSYFVESDATVAAYNKSRLGNTNRRGQNVEAYLKFKDMGFSLYAEMYRYKPINRDFRQFDSEMYFMGLETDYVSF